MKSKEKIKRFWTLDVHNHEGFTLVELIIVIAILAILSSVAVVGYSSYVEKANKQADKTLAGDVANALILHYYSNTESAVNDYIVLKYDAEAVAGSAYAEAAMIAAYGEDWAQVLKLKYAEWDCGASAVAEYFGDSSYSENEKELLGIVDDLSGALGIFIGENPETIGEGFSTFLTDNNIDTSSTTSTANAAVLYVSDIISKLNKTQQDTIVNALAGIGADYKVSGANVAISNASSTILNTVGNVLATTAILYAYAEAYCLHERTVLGESSNVSMTDVNFAEIEKPRDALDKVEAAFISVMENADIATALDYFGLGGNAGTPKAVTDARAALSSMNAINNVSNSIIGNLSSNDCYASSHGFVETYLNASEALDTAGGAAIIIFIDAQGNIVIDPKGVLN